MKSCAICGLGYSPAWHFARGTTFTRNLTKGMGRVNYFLFGGCKHAEVFKAGMPDPFIPDSDRAAIEARWDAHTEELFAQYTATWTEPQRVAYRARLWPTPPPVISTELALQ